MWTEYVPHTHIEPSSENLKERNRRGDCYVYHSEMGCDVVD
jgi:hypothetical protein